MSANTKAGQSIGKKAPAGDNDWVGVPVSRPGTIESVKVRIYSGAENTLHIKPQKKKNGAYEDLIAYPANGKPFIDGDDDVYVWDISEPVSEDHEVGVRYDNTDQNNPHNFRVNYDIDFQGGANRFTSLVEGVI